MGVLSPGPEVEDVSLPFSSPTRARPTAPPAPVLEAECLTSPLSLTRCTGAPGLGQATSPTPPTVTPRPARTRTGRTGTTSPPSPITSEISLVQILCSDWWNLLPY